jgi:hypothetical protein
MSSEGVAPTGGRYGSVTTGAVLASRHLPLGLVLNFPFGRSTHLRV